MVKYLSKCLQGLSDICEPLRRLIYKNATWISSSEQEQPFEGPTEGREDTSSKGLGFVLLQNGKPMTFNSRALNFSRTELQSNRKGAAVPSL